MEDIDFAAFQGMLSQKEETGVFARFYDRSVKTEKTDKNGLPVFDDVCYVRIQIKDNNTDIFDQPADEEKKRRFPVEFNRYLLSKKQIESGTPLEQFAFLTGAQIDTLKYRGIFTVEALSSLTEAQAQDLNVSKERELGIKFAEMAKNNAGLDVFQKKEDELVAKISSLENELSNKLAEIEDLKTKIQKQSTK